MQTDTITLRELTIRYTAKTDVSGQLMTIGRTISTPAECAAVFTTMLQDEASEVFGILWLSTKHRVLAYHEVNRGSRDSTLVHPREVFKAALLANAAATVLAHNHPSGVMHTPGICGLGGATLDPVEPKRAWTPHNQSPSSNRSPHVDPAVQER